jgi:GWxTD domain-containing protein
MTFLELWAQSASAKALAWTLLHSLWEGSAIALALAIVLGVTRSSRVRYAAACLAMLGLLAGFAVTLYRLAPREVSHSAARAVPLPVRAVADDRPVDHVRATWDASDLLPWLAPMWLAGVVLFQLRCLISWTAAGRLRRRGVCGAPAMWNETLSELRARLRMTQSVTLLESCFAEVPVVIGHLRPIILMPVGLLTGLPAGQVEAILLHELAHIRRADYLVNLMQTLVEGLMFYHPAAWWISGVMRAERENCCDDLVVLTSGDAHEYATALAALAENRWTMREPALAATGGNLVNRIRRLLSQSEGPRTGAAPLLSAGILIVTGAAALMAWQKPAPQMAIPGVLPLVVAQAQTAPASASSPYDKWLKEEAVYIITDEERAAFKKLGTDTERKQFIEKFWARRDPTPGTPANEYRDEHYRRIAYSNNRFNTSSGLPGWKTDRGRMYIQYGPPDEIDSHPSGGTYVRPPEEGGGSTVTYPFEQWRYKFIEGMGRNVILEFVDKAKTGDYRMTHDPAERALLRPQREQVEQNARLEEMSRALNRQRALMPETQRQIETALAQMQIAAKRLESSTEQEEQLKAQAQIVGREAELLRAEARKSLVPEQQQLLAAQRDLLEHQGEAERILRAQAEVPARQHDVFVSGPTPQAAVVILGNRNMLVTVPLEFPARQYSISIAAIADDGRMIWSATKDTSEKGSITINGLPLEPGSYTLKAIAKDSASSTEKAYVVNFSVK